MHQQNRIHEVRDVLVPVASLALTDRDFSCINIATNLCKLGGIMRDAYHGKVSNPRKSSQAAFEAQMEAYAAEAKCRNGGARLKFRKQVKGLTDEELAALIDEATREQQLRATAS